MLWQTGPAGPALPVPPVLSGRDQASATPSIAISHPLTGADAQEITMRIWRLHDYLLSNPAESNGQQADGGTLMESRGFIRSARLLPNSIEFRGRFARESACADYLSSAVGREGSTVPAAAMAEAGFAEPKPSRRISLVTCETKKLNGFSGRIMLHNSCFLHPQHAVAQVVPFWCPSRKNNSAMIRS